MAATRKVLLGLGSAASAAMIVLGVYGAAGASADQPVIPDPSLPTFYTPPNTYVINGDGSRTDCVAIDQALSCDWK